MQNEQEKMTKEEAMNIFLAGIRRAAMLHHHFSKAILEELGEEQGTRVIRKAIDAYGKQLGEWSREKAIAKGLTLAPENYQGDMPDEPWVSEAVVVDGETRDRCHVCPFAVEWFEWGDPKIGRLYCYVDQAKTTAFNPDYEYVHVTNILDGAPYCESVIRPVKK